MRTWHVFASVGVVVALSYVGVSWAVAGAGICVFATVALGLAWQSIEAFRHRSNPR
jgi:hypothetical protein